MTPKTKKFLTIAGVIVAVVIAILGTIGTVHFYGEANYAVANNDTLLMQNDQCTTDLKIERAAKDSLDKVIKNKQANDAAYQEIEDTLANLILPPPLFATGWNARRIYYNNPSVQDSISFGGDWGSAYEFFHGYLRNTDYRKARQAFIVNPGSFFQTFVRYKGTIQWVKNRFKAKPMSRDIIPYLQGKDNKLYWPRFNTFFIQHTTTPDVDILTNHPKWAEFQEGFYKQFPDAFGGDKSESDLFYAYSQYRSARTITSVPAKLLLVQFIDIWNAMVEPNP
jgi:hypothetical protein